MKPILFFRCSTVLYASLWKRSHCSLLHWTRPNAQKGRRKGTLTDNVKMYIAQNEVCRVFFEDIFLLRLVDLVFIFVDCYVVKCHHHVIGFLFLFLPKKWCSRREMFYCTAISWRIFMSFVTPKYLMILYNVRKCPWQFKF